MIHLYLIALLNYVFLSTSIWICKLVLLEWTFSRRPEGGGDGSGYARLQYYRDCCYQLGTPLCKSALQTMQFPYVVDRRSGDVR